MTGRSVLSFEPLPFRGDVCNVLNLQVRVKLVSPPWIRCEDRTRRVYVSCCCLDRAPRASPKVTQEKVWLLHHLDNEATLTALIDSEVAILIQETENTVGILAFVHVCQQNFLPRSQPHVLIGPGLIQLTTMRTQFSSPINWEKSREKEATASLYYTTLAVNIYPSGQHNVTFYAMCVIPVVQAAIG